MDGDGDWSVLLLFVCRNAGRILPARACILHRDLVAGFRVVSDADTGSRRLLEQYPDESPCDSSDCSVGSHSSPRQTTPAGWRVD